MNNTNTTSAHFACIESQPADVRDLPADHRDSLIISATRIDDHWVILSRYGDNIWQLEGFASNVSDGRRRVDFTQIPISFQAVMKALLFRYLRCGRAGQRRPKGITVQKFFVCAQPFLRHLETLNLGHLGAASPDVCASYVTACRQYRQPARSKGKPLSQGGLLDRFIVVEALYELSQYTNDPIQQHPWPGTSAAAMVGLTGSDVWRNQEIKTPLIPDDVFCTLFEKAVEQVQHGNVLLDLRTALAKIEIDRSGQERRAICASKNHYLATHGFGGNQKAFSTVILHLRTACYIVIASTSGCRNHELANIQLGAHHSSKDSQGTIYHWLRSKSEKTNAGVRDWMIPKIAVDALHLMERWAEPFQAKIDAEIKERRNINPYDPAINNAQQHAHALFLGCISQKSNQVRTLSCASWDAALKRFAKHVGLNWNLASHQFRRKFANYAAHSQFGDLRYLRDHFAHISMDMPISYAMDQNWGQHLDLELCDDIQSELEDIKLGIVESWMENEQLAGGYGRSIKGWQRDPTNLALFKSHAAMVSSIAQSTAIRSNGHAWCTADDNRCIGNTLERTRCGDCENAVIGCSHVGIYQRLYNNLKDLLSCSGIGDGGRQRVLRDLKRCRDVLMKLGHDPEKNPG